MSMKGFNLNYLNFHSADKFTLPLSKENCCWSVDDENNKLNPYSSCFSDTRLLNYIKFFHCWAINTLFIYKQLELH